MFLDSVQENRHAAVFHKNTVIKCLFPTMCCCIEWKNKDIRINSENKSSSKGSLMESTDNGLVGGGGNRETIERPHNLQWGGDMEFGVCCLSHSFLLLISPQTPGGQFWSLRPLKKPHCICSEPWKLWPAKKRLYTSPVLGENANTLLPQPSGLLPCCLSPERQNKERSMFIKS